MAFATSLLLAFWAGRARQRLGRKSLRGLLVGNLFEVAICVAIVAFVFSCLSLWAASHDNPATPLQTLERIEAQIGLIKQYTSWLKLDPAMSIGILTALVLLSTWLDTARSRRGKRHRAAVKRAQAAFDHYQRWTKRAAIIVAACTSVSFFGGAVDGVQAPLRARITGIRTNWVAFTERVGEALTTEVSIQLSEQALESAPPAYRAAVRVAEKDAVRLDALLEQHQREWSRYGLQGDPLDETGRLYRERRSAQQSAAERVSTVGRDLRPDGHGAAARPSTERSPAPPATASKAGIEQGMTALRVSTETLSAKFEKAPAKKLMSSLIGLALNPKHVDMIAIATEAFPVLEPLIGVVTSAVNSRLAEVIAGRAAAIAPALLSASRSPTTAVSSLIEASAQSVAGSANIGWGDSTTVDGAIAAARAKPTEGDLRPVYEQRFDDALRQKNVQLEVRLRAGVPRLKAQISEAMSFPGGRQRDLIDIPLRAPESVHRSRGFNVEDLRQALEAQRRAAKEDAAALADGSPVDELVARVAAIEDLRQKHDALTETLRVMDSSGSASSKLLGLTRTSEHLSGAAALTTRLEKLRAATRPAHAPGWALGEGRPGRVRVGEGHVWEGMRESFRAPHARSRPLPRR